MEVKYSKVKYDVNIPVKLIGSFTTHINFSNNAGLKLFTKVISRTVYSSSHLETDTFDSLVLLCTQWNDFYEDC